MKIILLLLILINVSIHSVIASHAHKSSLIDDTKIEIDLDAPTPARCKNGVTRTTRERELSMRSFDNCTIYDTDLHEWIHLTRDEVIHYGLEHFDKNGDKKVEKDECATAFLEIVPWEVRSVVPACALIFKRCDCDGDGIITIEDYENSFDTCLGHCTRIKLAYSALILGNFGPDEDGNTLQ